ncbi:MAG: tetratricopeptide repeat protein [Myxococcales bacterium]|nr:tetratricopeptide repeat protein [Myxococcales bacterium]
MDDQLRQLLTQGRGHYEKGEYIEAEVYLDQVLLRDRGHANVFNMLGVICHSTGRFTSAERHFEEALRLNPTYTEAALNLSVTYNDLGKYAEAKAVYGKAVNQTDREPGQLDPFVKGKLANMHAEVGDAYSQLGMYYEAIEEYRKALKLCPTFADLRTRLGTTLRDAGQRDQAVAEFEEAKRHNPRYLPARIHLGVTLFALGRKDEAAVEWQAVLAEDPENKSCQAYLSMLKE